VDQKDLSKNVLEAATDDAEKQQENKEDQRGNAGDNVTGQRDTEGSVKKLIGNKRAVTLPGTVQAHNRLQETIPSCTQCHGPIEESV